MSHFESLKQEALGSYGVVTFATARDLGISPGEFYRWVKDGRLVKTGRGVYRFTDYPMAGSVGDYVSILAEVGKDSYLCGETELGFLELCPVRSYVATVASPRRLRKKLPQGIIVSKSSPDYRPIPINGVPCQRVSDALRSAKVDGDRLAEAIDAAEQKGYLLPSEAASLRKELLHGQAPA